LDPTGSGWLPTNAFDDRGALRQNRAGMDSVTVAAVCAVVAAQLELQPPAVHRRRLDTHHNSSVHSSVSVGSQVGLALVFLDLASLNRVVNGRERGENSIADFQDITLPGQSDPRWSRTRGIARAGRALTRTNGSLRSTGLTFFVTDRESRQMARGAAVSVHGPARHTVRAPIRPRCAGPRPPPGQTIGRPRRERRQFK